MAVTKITSAANAQLQLSAGAWGGIEADTQQELIDTLAINSIGIDSVQITAYWDGTAVRYAAVWKRH